MLTPSRGYFRPALRVSPHRTAPLHVTVSVTHTSPLRVTVTPLSTTHRPTQTALSFVTMSLFAGIFGKKEQTSKEINREVQRDLRKQQREIEKEKLALERQEKKVGVSGGSRDDCSDTT